MPPPARRPRVWPISPDLPRLIVVTDTAAAGGRPVLDITAEAIAAGVRAVLVRDKQLPTPERVALAAGVRRQLDDVGGVLLVSAGRDATAVASAPGVAADGVHLGAADPWPTGPWSLVGRSCHGAADLRAAAAEGCRYAFLSPIFATASKPGYGPALGPEALRSSPLPVVALGGLTTPTTIRACLDAGAYGVAAMGVIMHARDVACVVATLLAVVD